MFTKRILTRLFHNIVKMEKNIPLVPEYTHGYLLAGPGERDQMKVKEFLQSLPAKTIQQGDLTLEFIENENGQMDTKASVQRFPVVRSLSFPENFSTVKYFENLKTNELGRLLIYTDVISSTMNVFNGQVLNHGMIVVAKTQTTGKGRGKNVWVSPKGCAMFALQMIVNLDSQIGQRIPLIQHLAALSVILSVPQHKDIKLGVKWPNDVYMDGKKIGGILVESKVEGKNISLCIGVGVNVSNDFPTVSLNSSLPESEHLSCETLIARTLTHLEKLVSGNININEILNLYKENWIHNEKDIVKVEVSPQELTDCQVRGIDEFGFLRVLELSTGEMFSVRCEGNSFDIANKLIKLK